MNTWSFRASAAAIALSALAGCEENFGGLGLDGPSPNGALSQARMAFGSVMLVPPQGYCIDRASLKQQFAMMARCDKLGAPSASSAEPLAIITASFSAIGPDAGLPDSASSADALGLTDVSAERDFASGIIFRAGGDTPAEGLDGRHWRATTRVGDQIMGLALYAPEGGAANGSDGPALLAAVIDATGPDGG